MRTIACSVVLLAAWALSPCATAAQVDPSGNWRTWSTEHFRIHAKTSFSSIVPAAASEAERAYSALSTELKPPSSRIELVLSDDADWSNGFTTVFPSNRITVYLTPPSTASALGVYDSWLRLVITHELTHAFHLDRADGVWGVLQKLLGRAPGLFPNAYQPGWVSEGIATYYESRFTAAGRMRGAYQTQLLRAAARDGTWPSSGDAVGVNPVWPAGSRPYAWGSHFFESQRTLFGDSVVPQFVDRTSRQLIVFNVSRPMKAAGGESVGDGWDRLKEPATEPSGGYTVLEHGLRVSPEPRVSPDGSRVGFLRLDGRSDAHIVVRDLRTGLDLDSRRVTSAGDIAWVGDTLYVTQLEYTSPVQIRSDIYRWEPGGRWERFTRGGRHTGLFSMGDGRLGLVSLRPGTRSVGVLSYPDTTPSEFPVPPSATDWGRIAMSPDGSWVAAARHADQQWDIVIWPRGRPDGYRMVTSDAAMDADPVWSADSESLLFSSERGGLPQIFAYDRRTGRTDRVTDESNGARHPALVGEDSILFSTVFGDGYALVQRDRRVFSLPVGEPPNDSPTRVAVSDALVREGKYAPWPALRPHFWIPVAHDERRAGLFFGALTFGQDAIGRTRYNAFVTVAPQDRRYEAVLYVAHKRWRAWTVDLAAGQTWEYEPFFRQGVLVPISFRERAAEVGLNYRWRRWRTAADVRLRGFVERDVVVNEGSEPLPFTPVNPTFVGSALSAAASSYSRPALSISPENGVSVDGLLLRRWQAGGGGLWSYEARARLSGYLGIPLPGFSNWVLALSIAAGRTAGPAFTTYSIGGESGDIVALVPGTALGSGRRTFQMRGYNAIGGFTRAVVGVAEIRVPIALVARGVPKLPLFLDRVSLNLFGEVGSGWTEGASVGLTALSDVGGEVAFDLGLGAGFAVKTRFGGAWALADGLGVGRGAARYYLAFGRAF